MDHTTLPVNYEFSNVMVRRLTAPSKSSEYYCFSNFYRNGKPCLRRLTRFKTSGVLEHSVYFIMVGLYTVGVTAYRRGFVSMHKLRVATN